MTESTIIEALYYLLTKIKKADKIKLVKLIYLADKYHLIRYGRTITDDDYYAMQYGPVGTAVKDILSFSKFNMSGKGFKYASKLLEKLDENNFRAKPEAKITFNMLSDTDKEALDYVIERFSKMTSWKLKEYTHKYPEWYKYEHLFENNLTKRERIETKELLSTIKNDPLAVSPKHIRESRKILTGTFG